MPCDQLRSGGFYRAWPEGSLLSSTSSFAPSLSAREVRVNRWCSVKSPLLINEYFLSREGGKERWIERGEREVHPGGRAACVDRSPCAVPVNGDPSAGAREGDGAEGKEEIGGWFTGWRLALENWSPSTKAMGLLLLSPLRRAGPGLSIHRLLCSTLNLRTVFGGGVVQILSQGYQRVAPTNCLWCAAGSNSVSKANTKPACSPNRLSLRVFPVWMVCHQITSFTLLTSC